MKDFGSIVILIGDGVTRSGNHGSQGLGVLFSITSKRRVHRIVGDAAPVCGGAESPRLNVTRLSSDAAPVRLS